LRSVHDAPQKKRKLSSPCHFFATGISTAQTPSLSSGYLAILTLFRVYSTWIWQYHLKHRVLTVPVEHSDRYERAPAEGEYFDPKGHMHLKQLRKWAKIATMLMALILIATVARAVVEEQPGLFFVVFFFFIILLGIIGIIYDHSLEQHKNKISAEKERKREILIKSMMISKNHPNNYQDKLDKHEGY
jgi:cbb3-type cytochrome oxidase subunit 3